MAANKSPRLFFWDDRPAVVMGDFSRAWVLNPLEYGGRAWREIPYPRDVTFNGLEIPPKDRQAFIGRLKSMFDEDALMAWDRIEDHSAETSSPQPDDDPEKGNDRVERTISPRLFLWEGNRVAVVGPGARAWVLDPTSSDWVELSRETAVDITSEAREIPPHERNRFVERVKLMFDEDALMAWDKIEGHSGGTSSAEEDDPVWRHRYVALRKDALRLFDWRGCPAVISAGGHQAWVLTPNWDDGAATGWQRVSYSGDVLFEGKEIPERQRGLYIERAKSAFDPELLKSWNEIGPPSSATEANQLREAEWRHHYNRVLREATTRHQPHARHLEAVDARGNLVRVNYDREVVHANVRKEQPTYAALRDVALRWIELAKTRALELEEGGKLLAKSDDQQNAIRRDPEARTMSPTLYNWEGRPAVVSDRGAWVLTRSFPDAPSRWSAVSRADVKSEGFPLEDAHSRNIFLERAKAVFPEELLNAWDKIPAQAGDTSSPQPDDDP